MQQGEATMVGPSHTEGVDTAMTNLGGVFLKAVAAEMMVSDQTGGAQLKYKVMVSPQAPQSVMMVQPSVCSTDKFARAVQAWRSVFCCNVCFEFNAGYYSIFEKGFYLRHL